MKYRQLGSSDLNVSEIALGSWLTYGAGINAGTARDCVRQAFDSGINFIDTANSYERGAAEEFLGETLSDYSRKDYVLATKPEGQEIALIIVLTPLAFWLGRTGFERFMLIICCVFVLIVELLNSAIEAAIDRFGEEHHELSGRAKDLGSAAVFLSLVIVAATWGTVAYLRFLT